MDTDGPAGAVHSDDLLWSVSLHVSTRCMLHPLILNQFQPPLPFLPSNISTTSFVFSFSRLLCFVLGRTRVVLLLYFLCIVLQLGGLLVIVCVYSYHSLPGTRFSLGSPLRAASFHQTWCGRRWLPDCAARGRSEAYLESGDDVRIVFLRPFFFLASQPMPLAPRSLPAPHYYV